MNGLGLDQPITYRVVLYGFLYWWGWNILGIVIPWTWGKITDWSDRRPRMKEYYARQKAYKEKHNALQKVLDIKLQEAADKYAREGMNDTADNNNITDKV